QADQRGMFQRQAVSPSAYFGIENQDGQARWSHNLLRSHECLAFGLKAAVPGVALIFPKSPLPGRRAADPQGKQVLGGFVAELGWHEDAQRSAMTPVERAAVHLVTQQGLRMATTGHVIRRVVIIVTQDANEAGAGIGANVIEEVRQTS